MRRLDAGIYNHSSFRPRLTILVITGLDPVIQLHVSTAKLDPDFRRGDE
jgi:hypothetical protein